MTKFGTGHLPSKKDSRGSTDVALYGAEPLVTIPESVIWTQYLHDTVNQLQTSSCTGQGNAHARYIREGILQTPNRKFPSARWMYWAGRRTSGQEHLDIGCMPDRIIQGMKDVGYCYEEDFPFSEKEINDAPDWKASKAAIDQRIAESYRIYFTGQQRCDEVKKALAAGYPCVFGTILDSSFDDYNSGLIEPMTGAPTGRHMMCWFGYDQEGVYGINSWGPDWGIRVPGDKRNVDGGIFKMSWRTVAWEGLDDIWCHT